MSAASKPVAIVLAAGAAQRFGSAKQTARRPDGWSFVEHAVRSALAVCDTVHVVLGAHRVAVQELLHGLPVRFIDNPQWQRGMGASIAAACAALLAEQCPHPVLLCLVDQPQVTAATLRRLIAAAEARPDRIIVSDYGANHGPPCLFPNDLLTELARLDGDEGARSVLKRHPHRITTTAVPEGQHDVDRAEDFARLGDPHHPH